MFSKIVTFALFVLYTTNVQSAYLTPCKWNDESCIKTSAQALIPVMSAGIPELDVPSTSPMTFNTINADNGEMKLTFTDLKVYGIEKCEATNIQRNVEKSTIDFELVCPNVIKTKYVLGGKLSIIAVEGSGDFEIISNKMKLSVQLKMKTEDGSDGKKYWKIESQEHTFEPLEKVIFKIDNLFNGDQKKAAPVLTILDESWKTMTTEIGKPIVKAVVEQAVKNVNVFFSKVPANELEVA